jgi:hypothetical protein
MNAVVRLPLERVNVAQMMKKKCTLVSISKFRFPYYFTKFVSDIYSCIC